MGPFLDLTFQLPVWTDPNPFTDHTDDKTDFAGLREVFLFAT